MAKTGSVHYDFWGAALGHEYEASVFFGSSEFLVEISTTEYPETPLAAQKAAIGNMSFRHSAVIGSSVIDFVNSASDGICLVFVH